MLELPDIEVFKQYFDATSLHQKVEDVSVRDDIVLKNLTTKCLQTELRGNSFESTQRYGKYLFPKIDDQWLAWHFGMTGRLQYFKDMADEPAYVPILICFENRYHLAYVCLENWAGSSWSARSKSFWTPKNLAQMYCNPILTYRQDR